jgi:hypothetical protein
LSQHMASTTRADAGTDNDFIWSPNATTTSAGAHLDWTNGFNVLGLPAAGTDSVTLTK